MRLPPRLVFVLAALAVILLLYASSSIKPTSHPPSEPAAKSWRNISTTALPTRPAVSSSETIDLLINSAQTTFDEILTRQSLTLSEAAAAYRKASGRHPPPGFDAWYKLASENNAVIVEEFWDQIYHDLNPFWGVEPALIRGMAKDTNMVVTIKNGVVKSDTDWFWHVIWDGMIGTIAHWLPDMIIPLNSMDEPRLFVPSEQIGALMAVADSKRQISPIDEVVETCKGWALDTGKEVDLQAVEWFKTTIYTMARQTCPIESPVRRFPAVLEHEEVISWLARGKPTSQHGDLYDRYLNAAFVTNSTHESDLCNDAMLGGMHGALVKPITSSSSKQLIPLFGGSKIFCE